ncbi:PLP-dependent aminotransferase family protein [uncultured Roseibium sp.]|uniref:aminotransferase-like domain-containing protein n=1 Tax=uncultured Roseibium sp. TaxID=1936171 RepID=UPI00260E8310|nr:PLP-dependent aminotransferase family protein [uncultured Roseibium sp.]
MTSWIPDLSTTNTPRYMAIADAIAADLAAGRLTPGDRLPAQRRLAGELGLDFTTVARGYAEAQRRGLLASQVGSGTYVMDPGSKEHPKQVKSDTRRNGPADFSMNLPPEPDDEALMGRMRAGTEALSQDLLSLLRYQTFPTDGPDREMALRWLKGVGLTPAADRVQFASGAQAALAGILSVLASPGDMIACEALTYPGIRSLCSQLNLGLMGLEEDDHGLDPAAFEAACKGRMIKALYLNPTLHNPTTRTLSLQRRKELAEISARHGVPILEDDAYGQLCQTKPQPFAVLAPETTWYVGSLSKCVGAGLRLAHVVAPERNASMRLARVLRSQSVMVSPIMMALASRWIEDGTANEMLWHIRNESAARQKLAAQHLKDQTFRADPDGFHLWLQLGNGWTSTAFVSQVRNQSIGLAESDAFVVSGQSPEAVRLCLGGPHKRSQVDTALSVIAETLSNAPQDVATYF